MADAVIAALLMLVAAVLGSAACAAGVVDPTVPPPGYAPSQRAGEPQSPDSPPPPEAVRLQMIARNGAARLAVVNGHRVRAGDAIALDGKSAKVVAIRDDAVVLDREGRRQVVELTPHMRLKPGVPE